MELYEACSGRYSFDDHVMNVILDESASYFDGEKIAEEVTKLIQNQDSPLEFNRQMMYNNQNSDTKYPGGMCDYEKTMAARQ